MNDPRDMLAGYLEGTLSADQVAELEAWLREDPARVRALVREAMLDCHLSELLHEQNLQAITADLSDDSQFGALLQELDARDGEAEMVNVTDELKRLRAQKPAEDPGGMSAYEIAAVTGYLLKQALTSRPALYTYAAAITLLAAVLLIPWGSEPTPTPPTAQQQPLRTTPTERPTVATLTAQHNATWAPNPGPGPAASAARETAWETARATHSNLPPIPGTPLHPGDRLTLTAGFAEITTAKGAVVILEAPATIELLDHDNALHLHEGKLVGICETPSSKGFVVHTPHIDITDLGTRFGVEVGQNKATHAAVFEGEIELSELSSSANRPARKVRLTAGWATKVSRKGVLHRDPQPLSAIDHSRYAKSIQEAAAPAFAYRRAVLRSKPIVYWGFDEQRRTTANLAGKRELNGRAIGQIDHAQGLFGSAVRLSGQTITMGGFASDRPLSLGTDGYTLEAWCRIDQPHHGRVMTLAIPNKDPQENPLHYSMIEVLAGQAVVPSLQAHIPSVRFMSRDRPGEDDVAQGSVFTPKPAPLKRWVHLVAVHHGNQAKVYMDGVLVAETDTDQAVIPQETLELFVGVAPTILKPALARSDLDFRCFNGRIDEVAVYDVALTADTIQKHYRLGRLVDGGQSLP